MLTDDQLKQLRAETPPWEPRHDPASNAQQRFIATLIREREVPETWLLNIRKHVEDGTLNKHKASSIISDLKKLPLNKEAAMQDPKQGELIGFSVVPAGYYAIPIKDPKPDGNDIAFYRVKKSKDNPNRGWVSIVLGPNEGELTQKQAMSVLTRIRRYGLGKAAELYGIKTGRCSQCNRRLTNRISRELKMGPKCGGRVYSEGWQDRVNKAVEAIIERGEDPNEKVE
jgi:hypothetical protein